MTVLSFLRENAKFLIAGILLTFVSSAGQTFFISIFAAEILRDFDLTNGEWGLLYTLATTAAAVAMFWAGALTDRFRARFLAVFVLPGLALSCVAMALGSGTVLLFTVICFLRFLGQGMVFQLAAVSMARWFVARRGTALAISGMGFWIGQAVLPVAYAALLADHGWRALWHVTALGVLLCFPVIFWLLAQERTPRSIAEESHSVGMGGRHWTRAEVLRSRFFWLLVPILLGPPAWGTALFFQQVHIADVKGWDLVDYLALVPIMTLVSVGATLLAGGLIDHFGSGRTLQAFPVFWIAGFLTLAFAGSLSAALVAFVVFGMAMGLQATLFTAFWAEYFGTRHIGAIKASATSLMVFGSAIGPGLSGVLIDAGWTFPEQMTGIALYFLFAMALVWLAIEEALRRLPRASEIHVERA